MSNWQDRSDPNMSLPSHSFQNSSSISEPQHEVHTQDVIPESELIDSIANANVSDQQNPFLDDDDNFVNDETNRSDLNNEPTMEQIQRVYYTRGLEELETLNLLDLSPLANWKLSSHKQGYGLPQLRDDSPDTYWQSDGSNGSNNSNSNNNGIITNNQLSNPHSITIQFSKRVSLERISLFTNYNLDESYTPLRIKVMAGTSDGWDLSEVCTVNFSKPVGWSHIIFSGVRDDKVLKCFMVKLVILANHQDGKDTHIRALKCFGKKSFNNGNYLSVNNNNLTNEEILKDLSLNSAISSSGFLLNNLMLKDYSTRFKNFIHSHLDDTNEEINDEQAVDKNTSKYLDNAAHVIGFNTGFQSTELKSVSSIR